MSQDKIHKSEDERITDLENLVVTFQSRFASLERLAGGGPQPLTFYPFYMPVKGEPVGEPVGEPIADDAALMCFEDITTPIDGMKAYAEVAANDPCPDPTPENKADAALDARNNLAKFAQKWCDAGDRACTSNNCAPTLSNIKVTGYKTSSRPKDGKKQCIVTASITGTVSCRCA